MLEEFLNNFKKTFYNFTLFQKILFFLCPMFMIFDFSTTIIWVGVNPVNEGNMFYRMGVPLIITPVLSIPFVLILILMCAYIDESVWFRDLILSMSVFFSLANITGNYLSLILGIYPDLPSWGMFYWYSVTIGLSVSTVLIKHFLFSRLKT